MRASPRLVRAVAGPLVRGLAHTWRFRVEDDDRWRAARSGTRPVVLLCWHEVLLPLVWHHRRQDIAVVVSQARDGQYLADFCRTLGYQLVRGSSTRGGARALLGAVRALQQGTTVAFTPDGPLGPRRVVKPGGLAAAQRAGAVVLPLHAEISSAWRLDSWDRFAIPRPAARIRVRYGLPMTVDAGPAGLEAGVAAAQAALEQLAGGHQWQDDGATGIA